MLYTISRRGFIFSNFYNTFFLFFSKKKRKEKDGFNFSYSPACGASPLRSAEARVRSMG